MSSKYNGYKTTRQSAGLRNIRTDHSDHIPKDFGEVFCLFVLFVTHATFKLVKYLVPIHSKKRRTNA